ncbi:MAG TPA: biotin/lipoyl-binding protein, partial [Tahibacter sp.]|nr:biotin/lipoyl-binding protein [Tahibacter sp.]
MRRRAGQPSATAVGFAMESGRGGGRRHVKPIPGRRSAGRVGRLQDSKAKGIRMDSSDKLGQLRIDRNEPPPSGSGKTFLVVGIVAALALGVGAWMYFGRGTTWTVATAMAQPVTTASAATSAGGSVLDATGYVTARRQATVSAKVTGRVSEVMIEEGQKVEEGQVLARLEAIDAQAQLDLSRSQLDAARALLTEQRVQLAQAERDLKRQN